MAAEDDVEVVDIDDDEAKYCFCQLPYDDTRFMIECNVCMEWFHGDCVGIEERQASEIEVYHCPKCQPLHGPLQLKVKLKVKVKKKKWKNAGKFDWLDGDSSAPITGNIKKFVKSIQSRSFLPGEDLVEKVKGYQLDKDYVEANGLVRPILVEEPAGLDLSVPPPDFTVDDVEMSVGSMRELDVIDVAKQSDGKMLMREFVQYYNNPEKDRILNVISLEFSNTNLSKLVTPPRIVEELSWVSRYWPEHTGEVRTFVKPEVQKYCLMSVKDSYTDFHIDFGGTSVWYHIIRGKKIFYFIEPTDANLALYETWTSSASQNSIFFGDQVDGCYKLVMTPGQTLFIPTGWIHAVYTPENSLVFGGNFLHDYNIGLQLDIFEMENRIGTPSRFQFPNFETLCWFAARNLSENLKDSIDDGKVVCQQVLTGCDVLRARLECYMAESDPKRAKKHKNCLPDGISHKKLLKELCRLIVQAKKTWLVKQASEGLAHDRKVLLSPKCEKHEEPPAVSCEPAQPTLAQDNTDPDTSSSTDDNSDADDAEERKFRSYFSDDTYVYPSLIDSDDEAPCQTTKKAHRAARKPKVPSRKVNINTGVGRPRECAAIKRCLSPQRQERKKSEPSQAYHAQPPPAIASHSASIGSVAFAGNKLKSKVKRGEKTAKQRLGKLLKIHKYNM